MSAHTAAPGILTYGGALVGPDVGVPRLADVALALSRVPRFGGHGAVWWSVCDHALYCAGLAAADAVRQGFDRRQARALELAALLHDAHEALTGDVPTPFKRATPAVGHLQERLDGRILDAHFPGGHAAFLAFAPEIHAIDRRALLAEALVVGPPACDTVADVAEWFGQAPDPDDVALLQTGCFHTDPAELRHGHGALNVARFVGCYRFCMRSLSPPRRNSRYTKGIGGT